MVQKKNIHNAITGETVVVDYTADEQAVYDDYNSVDKINERKLENIKKIRLEKLIETDYLANSDMIMTQAMKDYRQGMRDIPQNNTTEEYDLLLAKVDKKLTHEIWSKP
mgnify:CR=1 FL=1